jgi:S-formylglutathione hydrolase FrmB
MSKYKYCDFRALTMIAFCAIVFASTASAQDAGNWVWNDPKVVSIPGVTHHTINSPSMKRTVGFNVYLPPHYETESDRRFPVVYFLHGAGGTETSDAGLAWQVAAEIKAGRIEPCIYVFPNGGKRSGYRDWEDQNVKSETLIMKELIPRVDKKFRTINDGRRRGICGFSMGGGGALRLALKYPDQFCAAASLAAAFDGDDKGHNGDNVHVYAKQNQQAIRNSLALSLVVGSEDFLQKRHPAFLSLLKELRIKYSYRQLDDVGHNLGLYNKHSGADMIRFIAQATDSPQESVSDAETTQQQDRESAE